MKKHILQAFVSDLMAPEHYGALCSCGWNSRYKDKTVDESRNRWASHVYEQEARDD